MPEPRGREKAGRPRKSAGRNAAGPTATLTENEPNSGEPQGRPARRGSDKEASAAVRAYLDELTQMLPRRGRRRDPSRLRRETGNQRRPTAHPHPPSPAEGPPPPPRERGGAGAPP